ncbi:Carotenoid cleavage dioxygenase [Burkholderia sp. D7]|nr:Carotenoid cleavage dioxygenase [Burkholderia sp. D7]
MTVQLATNVDQPLPTVLASNVLSGPLEGMAVVEGRIPSWLHGRLIRTAPAVFEFGNWRAKHWFDALGMLYAFDIDADGRVRWAQRLLECEFSKSVLAATPGIGGFGTPDGRRFIQRLLHPVPRTTDNTNVNILPTGVNWTALTETDRQLLIDPATLRTQSEQAFTDTLPRVLMSAHPHYDFARRELVNFGITYGAKSSIMVFRVPDGSQRRLPITTVPLRRVPYLHSFSITRSKAVLILHPYDLNPAGLICSGRPIGDHYRWSPEQGTRVLVIDRETGRTTEHAGASFFSFHMVNAFDEDDGGVVLDLLTYENALLIREGMQTHALRANGMPDLTPTLQRMRIPAGGTGFDLTPIADEARFEFPSVNYARVNGTRHRYTWGSDLHRVMRVDTVSGTTSSGAINGMAPGEPIFVSRPGGTREDDGVLLTVGSAIAGGHSELTVWDAATLNVLARARVPVPIPLGFHGSFQMDG